MRKSAPIAMAKAKPSAAPAAEAAAKLPAWGSTAAGGSPPGVTLRDIQVHTHLLQLYCLGAARNTTFVYLYNAQVLRSNLLLH